MFGFLDQWPCPFPFPPVTIVVDEDASKVMSVPPVSVAGRRRTGSRRPGRGGPDIVSMPIPPFRKVTVSTVLPSAPAFRRRWPRCPARRRSTDIAIPVLSVQTTVRVTDRAIVSRRTQNGGRPRRLPLSCSPPVAFRSFCYLVDTLFDCRSLPSTGSVKCLLRGKAVQKAAQEFKV